MGCASSSIADGKQSTVSSRRARHAASTRAARSKQRSKRNVTGAAVATTTTDAAPGAPPPPPSDDTRKGGSPAEDNSVTESMCRTRWLPGYLVEDATGVAVHLHTDYSGVEVSTSSNASKYKVCKVCAWVDGALEARRKCGGMLYNPENPYAWPDEVIDVAETNSVLNSHLCHHSVEAA